MNIKVWSNPKYTDGKSKEIKYTFEPGVTMLIGTNGSGKTTLMKQIYSIFNDGGWVKIPYNDKIRNEYSCFKYDNRLEDRDTKQHWLDSGNVDRLAATFQNSEGQDMYDFLYYKMNDLGRFIRLSKNKEYLKGAVILLDGLDSGLSLDKLEDIRKNLLNLIIDTDNNKDFEVYIICSANSFEFCNGYNCIDVSNQQKLKFNKYELFRDYMLGKVNNDNGYED